MDVLWWRVGEEVKTVEERGPCDGKEGLLGMKEGESWAVAWLCLAHKVLSGHGHSHGEGGAPAMERGCSGEVVLMVLLEVV